MKITANQLRQIIKEEVRHHLRARSVLFESLGGIEGINDPQGNLIRPGTPIDAGKALWIFPDGSYLLNKGNLGHAETIDLLDLSALGIEYDDDLEKLVDSMRVIKVEDNRLGKSVIFIVRKLDADRYSRIQSFLRDRQGTAPETGVSLQTYDFVINTTAGQLWDMPFGMFMRDNIHATSRR